MAELQIPQPYPGIRPFREDDWPIFFGREAQSNQLLHKLETTRFVAVVGSSGSGKSSLVRAGLIPLIRQGFLRDVKDWDILLCRPGVDPFAGLAYEISLLEKPRPLDGNSDSEGESVTSNFIAAELRTSPDGIVSVIEKLKLPQTCHILLIVDQFEEIFGFRSSLSEENAASRGEAERFVDCILQSCAAEVTSPLTAQERSLPQRIWAVLTMRSDFIGHCEVFPALARCVSNSQFLVPVLNSEQKQEAISRPGETEMIDGAAYAAFNFDDGVVSVIVNETGDRLDQLPLMQHALMRTWKLAKDRSDGVKAPVRIGLDDYQAVGRIHEALHNDAEKAWKEIAGDERLARITRQMFLLLCDTSDEGKLTRKRPKVSSVMAATGARLEDLETILGAFQRDDRNFLRPIVSPISSRRLVPDDALDVSHEALLRQWRTYRSWQIEERRNIDELVDLRRRAQLNVEKKEPLLGQMTLDRLEKWKGEVNLVWASRYISEADWNVIHDFIEKSKGEVQEKARDEEKRKQRQNRRILGGIAATAAVSAIISAILLKVSSSRFREADQKLGFATAQAEFQRQRAEMQQGLRLTGMMGSADKEPSTEETLALWELTQLPVENEAVRDVMLKMWFESSEYLARALARNGQGLTAAVGISPQRLSKLRSRTVLLISDAADSKARRVPDPEAWRAFSAWLDAASAKEASEVLIRAIENVRDVDGGRLANLGNALVGLLDQLGPDDAGTMAKRGAVVLASAMEKTQESDLNRLANLSSAFAKLISKMAPDDAQLLVTPDRLEILTKGLRKAVTDEGRLSSSSSESARAKGPKATLDSTEIDPPSALAKSLVDAAKIAKPVPQDVAALTAEVLVDAVEHLPSIDVADGRAFRWAGSIGDLVKMMKVEKDAADFRSRAGLRLSIALAKQPRSSQALVKERWSVVVDLCRGMKVPDQRLFADKLIELLDHTPEASAKLNLSVGIAQLAAVMGEDEGGAAAERAADIVLKAFLNIQEPSAKETDVERRKRLSTVTYDTSDLGIALARLAKVMKPKSRGPMIKRVVIALLDKQTSERWRWSDALSELCRVVNVEDIPEVAEALASAMEVGDGDAFGLWSLGTTLADLSTRLKTAIDKADKDQPSVKQNEVDNARDRAAEVLVKALEEPRNTRKDAISGEKDVFELLMYAIALERVDRSPPSGTSTTIIGRAATVLLGALENPEKLERDLTDPSTLVLGLSRLGKHMMPEEANKMAERAAVVIAKAMDDAQKSGSEPKQVSNLAMALGDLCKMITKAESRAEIARHASAILVASQGSKAGETAKLGEALLTLVQFLPAAKTTRNFALYERMSVAIPPKPVGSDKEPEDRQLIITECGKHSTQELAEILKWPCCVGEAQKIVLTEMEGKTNRKFDGNVWKFVDQAPDLDLTNLDGPAQRPKADKASQELAQLSAEAANSK
jgi:hypothetical protein